MEANKAHLGIKGIYMPCYTLFGAGFSRNWGGWLASEVFEYLLGCPKVKEDEELVKLLWEHKNQGGFESALAHIQTETLRLQDEGRDGEPEHVRMMEQLDCFSEALLQMFLDMDQAFASVLDFEFQQDINRTVRTFLARFDIKSFRLELQGLAFYS